MKKLLKNGLLAVTAAVLATGFIGGARYSVVHEASADAPPQQPPYDPGCGWAFYNGVWNFVGGNCDAGVSGSVEGYGDSASGGLGDSSCGDATGIGGDACSI